jgi:hypothetical protein
MNDRYRNVCKALDHIAKCRTKEAKMVFIPYCGYVVTPSDELLKARIRRNLCKESKEFYKKVRSYYETTMQGVPI